MQSSWERINGRSIFFARYNDLTIEQLGEEVEAVQKEMNAQPPNSVLLLVDPRDALVTPASIELFKNVANNSKAAFNKTAVLRMGGWKAFVLDIVLGFARIDDIAVFDDEESATRWLLAD